MAEQPRDESVDPEGDTIRLKSERIGRQLTDAQIAQYLRVLPGWRATDDAKALQRTFELSSFRAAVAFVAYLAELVEATERPPEVEIRGNEVTLTLRSQSATGLSEHDFDLASRIHV